MTTKNVDWNAMGVCVGNSLNEVEFDRQNITVAFDLIRETIMDHLCIYIDKRHLLGFRVEITTAKNEIHASLLHEGKTLCKWSV